ncbi:MAG: hypothetical protein KIT79_14880, partial [Deltaproteobacteria bacterium]|nr:hypothetical protein [Deltaproteobacteria bacterium]
KFFKVVLAVVVIAATSALAGLVFAAIGGTNLGVAAGVGGFTGGSLGLARSAHRNVDDLEGMLVGSMIGTGIGILTGILTYLGGAYIRENLTEVSEFLGDSARNAGKEALEGLQTQPGGQAAAGGEVAYSLARKIFRPALNFIFQDGPWAEGIRSAVFTGGTVTGGYFAAKRIDQLVDYLKNRRNCISVDIHGNSMSHACPI